MFVILQDNSKGDNMVKKRSEETAIAVIDTNISHIKEDISQIKQTVKDLAGVYITKLEFEDVRKALIERLDRLEKSSNLWKFLSPTFAAISGSIGTFLLINYLQNLR